MASPPAEVEYSREEFARRGDEIYERKLAPCLRAEDDGKFAAIDIVSGDYEIDRDELTASNRLRARHPEAQVWLRQIGSSYTYRFGSRRKSATA